MDIAAIISVIGASVTVGGLFIQWRKAKSEIKVSETQTAVNITEAAENALSVVREAMQFSEQERLQEREELTALIRNGADALLQASVRENELEDRIRGLEDTRQTYRAEHEARVIALENSVRDLFQKSQEWESRYITLQEQYNTLKDKYNKAIEILVGALDEERRAKVMPELALLLGDSIAKFKFPRKP